jgi:type VI protein secretion system component VasK
MTTMHDDPDAIRAEIDRTRGRLSEDVDVLAESVRPSSVARRTGQRVTSRATRLKETVMGTASDAGGSVKDSAHSARDSGAEALHGATDAVRSAPDVAKRQTRGNPLAAGAVALAAGWLVGSLLPASEKERELASTAKEQAQPLMEEAKSMAQETAEHLKEPAQQAVESVKDSARQGAQTVKHDSTEAAQNVKDGAERGSGIG